MTAFRNLGGTSKLGQMLFLVPDGTSGHLLRGQHLLSQLAKHAGRGTVGGSKASRAGRPGTPARRPAAPVRRAPAQPGRRAPAPLAGATDLPRRDRAPHRAEPIHGLRDRRELLETRLVAEVGDGPSKGGRRPIVLQFQDDAYGLLGIDMGAAHVSAALANLRGQVIAWEHRHHPVRTDPDGALRPHGRAVRGLPRRWKLGTDRLVGIGVGVPSPVDPRNPTGSPTW